MSTHSRCLSNFSKNCVLSLTTNCCVTFIIEIRLYISKVLVKTSLQFKKNCLFFNHRKSFQITTLHLKHRFQLCGDVKPFWRAAPCLHHCVFLSDCTQPWVVGAVDCGCFMRWTVGAANPAAYRLNMGQYWNQLFLFPCILFFSNLFR